MVSYPWSESKAVGFEVSLVSIMEPHIQEKRTEEQVDKGEGKLLGK